MQLCRVPCNGKAASLYPVCPVHWSWQKLLQGDIDTGIFTSLCEQSGSKAQSQLAEITQNVGWLLEAKAKGMFHLRKAAVSASNGD